MGFMLPALLSWSFLALVRPARIDLAQVVASAPLCQKDIVDETCALLSGGWKVFQRGLNGKILSLSFGELQGALHTSFDSLVRYMDFIGLNGRPGDFRVNCMQLCQLTVASLPPTHRPPSSDVACYSTFNGVACDIDVSDDGYADVHFETEKPDGSSKFERPGVVKPREDQVDGGTLWSPDLEPVDPQEPNDRPENVGLDQLRISVANLFRIYPPFELEVTESSHSEESDDPAVVSRQRRGHRKMSSALQKGAKINDEDCFGAVTGAEKRESSVWLAITFNDKKCKCPRGTVVKGQSDRCRSVEYVEDRRKFNPDDLARRGCYCQAEDKVRENIPVSCRDKFPTGFKDRYGRHQSCEVLKKRCHERHVYEVCPTTCKTSCLAEGGGDERPHDMVEEEAPWKKEVAKNAVKAQAYTAKAIRAMGKRKAGDEVVKWFGEKDEWTREQVLRVLNGIHRLLSNVDYVYPGRSCDEDDYAYVYPKAPGNKNQRGRYVFHLCELYMKSSTSTQIETLTHEGSHHETMYTDDVCAAGSRRRDCRKAYGRKTCEILAKAEPEEAQKNADNYCFFINDVAQKNRHKHHHHHHD